MITTSETLTVNGVVLNTLAKNIESLSGRLRSPTKRGSNLVISGRDGSVKTRKRYEEQTIVLPMWVVGADDDGLVPTGQTEKALFWKNIDDLTRLFTAETLEIVHTLPGGSSRRIFGEVLDVIDFATASNVAKFSVSIVCPSPFWEDTTTVQYTFSGRGGFAMGNWAGATAPTSDAEITFRGPYNNPSLSTVVNGRTIKLNVNAVIPAGQSVLVKSADWTVSGANVVPGNIDHSGDPRWMVIPPTAAGSVGPAMTISDTGSANTGSVTILGRRKYMVG